jgi:hypothetical protein
MQPNDINDPGDDHLRQTLRGDPYPPPPELEARVIRLVRRRRVVQRWSVGLAAAAVIGVAVLALVDRKPGPRQPAEVVRATEPGGVMKEVDVVVRDSPVLRLDSDRQQAVFLSLFLLVATQTKTDPAPMTDEQLVRLRALIKETQERAAAIKAQLDDRERELARLYLEYELNEPRATVLEAEIVALQRDKFANYHKMQVELRTIVGKERFDLLKQRLRYSGFFGPEPPKAPERPRSNQ